MLSSAQLDLLNRALLLLYEPTCFERVPDRFFEVVSMVVPGHFVHISVTDPEKGAVDAFMNLPAHEELMAMAQQPERMKEIPGVSDGSFYHRANEGPVSFHDLMGFETLKSTVLWESFCRPLDLRYDLSVNFWSSVDRFYTISSSRDRIEHSGEERTLLGLLQPHLSQRFRQLAASEPSHPLAPIANFPLDTSWITCSDNGLVLSFGAMAIELLRKFGLSLAGQLPVVWRDWLTRQLTGVDATKPPIPLVVVNGIGVLTVYALCNRHSGEHRLILRQGDRLEVALTAREREIARWLTVGKTNPEIAEILGISRATVKNHVEHILGKLQVENRTAAAGVLRERGFA